MPPGQFGRPERVSATQAGTERRDAVVPRQWPAAVPRRSEAVPVPNPADVRKSEPAEGTGPAPSVVKPVAKLTADAARAETVSGDPGRGNEEHDTFRERIREEAEKLGFAVEVGGRSGTRSLPRADLTITKGSVSLMVEIAVSTTPDQEFEIVRRCLVAGPGRVVVVCPNPEELKKLAEQVHASVTLAEAMRVSYFTPEEFSAELVRLAAAEKSVSPAGAKQRKKERDAAQRGSLSLPPEEHTEKENPA